MSAVNEFPPPVVIEVPVGIHRDFPRTLHVIGIRVMVLPENNLRRGIRNYHEAVRQLEDVWPARKFHKMEFEKNTVLLWNGDAETVCREQRESEGDIIAYLEIAVVDIGDPTGGSLRWTMRDLAGDCRRILTNGIVTLTWINIDLGRVACGEEVRKT